MNFITFASSRTWLQNSKATYARRFSLKNGQNIMDGRRRDLTSETRILRIIMVICGEKVILDLDLVELYVVETRRLNEQVRCNIEKFPEDFMFRLTKKESNNLKSQIAIPSSGWSGLKGPSLPFTPIDSV